MGNISYISYWVKITLPARLLQKNSGTITAHTMGLRALRQSPRAALVEGKWGKCPRRLKIKKTFGGQNFILTANI